MHIILQVNTVTKLLEHVAALGLLAVCLNSLTITVVN